MVRVGLELECPRIVNSLSVDVTKILSVWLLCAQAPISIPFPGSNLRHLSPGFPQEPLTKLIASS